MPGNETFTPTPQERSVMMEAGDRIADVIQTHLERLPNSGPREASALMARAAISNAATVAIYGCRQAGTEPSLAQFIAHCEEAFVNILKADLDVATEQNNGQGPQET